MGTPPTSKPSDLAQHLCDAMFTRGGGHESSHVLVQHQLDTFNNFLECKLGQIIQGFNPIHIYHKYDPELKDFAFKLTITVRNPTITKPVFQAADGSHTIMTPHMARMNNLTYAGALQVDVAVKTEVNVAGVVESSETSLTQVPLGRLPIMVRCKACILTNAPGLAEDSGRAECRYDPGGYFVVSGNEKVVISQDRLAENRTLIFPPNGGVDDLHAEIRSMPDGLFLPPKTTSLHMHGKPNHHGHVIRLNASFLRSEVPLFTMFRALGVESDREILHHVLLDPSDPKRAHMADQLRASAEDACEIHTQADALETIAKCLGMTGVPREYLEDPAYALGVLRQTLVQDFLPHCGHSLRRKALYLGFMVRKLLSIHLGYQPFDNRDSCINKRIDTPGVLYANLFRQCYGKMIKDMKGLVVRELNGWRASGLPPDVLNATNIHRFFKQTTIEAGLKYALSTGNWGVKSIGSYQSVKAGVAQVLNRLSYLSTISHLRRLNTGVEHQGKLVQPRKLEATQFGFVCPHETPEGAAVGLVKNLAMSAHISVHTSSLLVRELLRDAGLAEYGDDVVGHAALAFLKDMGAPCSAAVMVNGDVIGYHRDPVGLVTALRAHKRSGVISPTTGVAWDVRNGLVSISTEAGRLYRPLHIVDGNSTLRARVVGVRNTFAECVVPMDSEGSEGVVEYLDVEEVDKAMIAMTEADLCAPCDGFNVRPLFTHAEIHPALMNGVVAGAIPFMQHNQAPRVCYQSSMGKQAVSLYATNFNGRMDTMAHVLNYPERPLVSTRMSKYLFQDRVPCGVNAIVAIMTMTGFNQEDSVMINQSALDRGLLGSTYYKTYQDVCSKNHSSGEEEVFTKPSVEIMSQRTPYNYDKLGPDGFVPKNTYVGPDDVLIGKIMPHKRHGTAAARDTSLAIKYGDEGYVDDIHVGTNADGYTFAQVRLRQFRQPEIGDKVCSRSSQKGICGMVFRQEDMPFTKDGIVPDIIMNPHAIPSRMTVAQLMECIMAKAAAGMGTYGDATPFNGCTVEDLAKALESTGYERYGNEILYNGRTGEQVETEIFIGPTYYQRLKHMVRDKVHCLTPDHDVLTRARGWVPINEVSMEDEVAILQGHGKHARLAYERPAELYHYPDYEGQLYHIRTDAVDLQVTMNHRMYCSVRDEGKHRRAWQPYELVEAAQIVGKAVRYRKDAVWEAPDYQHRIAAPLVNPTTGQPEVKERRVSMEHWLTFLGAWLVEGGVAAEGSLIHLPPVRERAREEVLLALRRLHLEHTLHPSGIITVDNQPLAEHLRPLATPALEARRLPEWVWQLSAKQSGMLLESLVVGNTIYHQQDNGGIYTTSEGLADDVQRLCVHAGWTTNKLQHVEPGASTLIRGVYGPSRYMVWRLCLAKRKTRHMVNAHKIRERYREKLEEVVEYTGPVSCLSVSSEVFLVRRNGRVVFTGNSRGANGPNVMLTRQPTEGRSRNGGLKMGNMECDALVSSGVATFTKEKLLDASDNFKCYVCRECGLPCTGNDERGIYGCMGCKNAADIVQVRLPYAYHLLSQELASMNMALRMLF